MVLLVVLLLAIGLYFCLQSFFKNNWKKDLEVSIRFSKKAMTAGENCQLIETISNHKKMPLLSMEVKFAAPANMEFADSSSSIVTDKFYRRDFFLIQGYQKINRTLDFSVSKRGYYQIDNIDVLVKDFLMMHQYVDYVANDAGLYVYPEKINTDRMGLFFRKELGRALSAQRHSEDPFSFRGLRDYQRTDGLAKINWKASARADKLLVNLKETASLQKICILLDGTSSAAFDTESLQEEGIKIASSLAMRFLYSGVRVSLYSNGTDCLEGGQIMVPSGSGKNHQEQIDRSLAKLIYKPAALGNASVAAAALLDLARKQENSSDVVYLLISSQKTGQLKEFILEQKKQGNTVFAIIPCSSKEKRVLLSDRNDQSFSNIFLWEVIV